MMPRTLYRAYEAILQSLVDETEASAAVLLLTDVGNDAPHILAQVGPGSAINWARLIDLHPPNVFIQTLASATETTAILAVQAECQSGWLPSQQRLIRGAARSIEALSRAGKPEIDWGSIVASHRILPVTEEELSRIVLDIHDGPVQKIFAALNHVNHLQHAIESAEPGQKLDYHSKSYLSSLEQISKLLEISLTEIRTFLGAFRPPEFGARSLLDVLEGLIIQHEELTDTTVFFEVENEPPLVSVPVKIAFYRILQESLSNSVRHAKVNEHFVRLWMEDGKICMEVVDFGPGFTPPRLTGPEATEKSEHIGLRGMRDRVQLIGGQIEIVSAPDEGTRVTVKVPYYG